jgi:hypothetical protein
MTNKTRLAALRGVLMLALSLPVAVWAGPDHRGDRGRRHGWVPEFDPAAAGTVAAILAGGGVLLARRRGR